MGLARVEQLTVATGVPTRSERSIGPGRLYSACVYIMPDGTSIGEIHVRVTLERGGTDNYYSVATLIDEYVYDGHQPSWDGRIPLDASDLIVCTTWATVARRLTVNCATDLRLSDRKPG